MDKEKLIKKHEVHFHADDLMDFIDDLDRFENYIKENCAKELIDKIFIGVDRKHTVGWHSYFKIGNQTFYMTTCETKNEAEWFAEQLKCAIMSIAKAF